MSLKAWINIVTVVLLSVVVWAAWPKIHEAYLLLGSVNLWILSLMIPAQIISYYAAGSIMFSYLQSNGHLAHLKRWDMARLSLEFNFVNHLLPSGGAAGFSFLTFILHKHGVSTARSTMAQVIRHVLTFLSFVILLVISVALLAIDEKVNRYVIGSTFLLVVGALALTWFIIFIFDSSGRMKNVALWIYKITNKTASFVTRGKKADVLKLSTVENYFQEVHKDYKLILKEKSVLIKPFLWSVFANLLDVALFFIAFWALGAPVNPALLFISFGISSIASVITVLPGGAGVYEALMIAFLTSAGVNAEVAIAGTLLARVILLGGTIAFGYIFYQMTINQYGKHPSKR